MPTGFAKVRGGAEAAAGAAAADPAHAD